MGMVRKMLLWKKYRDNLSKTFHTRTRIKDIGVKFYFFNFPALFMTCLHKGRKSGNCIILFLYFVLLRLECSQSYLNSSAAAQYQVGKDVLMGVEVNSGQGAVMQIFIFQKRLFNLKMHLSVILRLTKAQKKLIFRLFRDGLDCSGEH